MSHKTTKLNPRQKAAFALLASAIQACKRENIYLWDDYGVLSAVNGDYVGIVAVDTCLDEPLEGYEVARIESSCFHGYNSDDLLYIGWKAKGKSGRKELVL